ncbi:MAG: hypothetical protein HYS12_25165, partial [Planctomycetes bacterium]|nr:hypothetical protein [Planctomycetota bacterium]
MPEHTEPDSKPVTTPAVSQTAENPTPFSAEQVGQAQSNQAEETLGQKVLSSSAPGGQTADEAVDETGDWEEEESFDPAEDETAIGEESGQAVTRARRRKRQLRPDAAELRLRGRRALCKRIADIASQMLKTVMLRVLGSYLKSKHGLEDEDLTQLLKKDGEKLADRTRVLNALKTPDPDFSRDQLKAIIFNILLQEETHSVGENRLHEKVIDFEKDLVKRGKTLDFSELKRQDPDRWHHYDTYRIVLEAAWSNDDLISPDEARLLAVLRTHLGISLEEHWLISALLKRFPKEKCALHTPEEINEARKELQRQGLLWSYRDENNRNIDVIPAEIAAVIRRDFAGQELQRTNYRRLLHHD